MRQYYLMIILITYKNYSDKGLGIVAILLIVVDSFDGMNYSMTSLTMLILV
jgi:hypothetical protein